MKKNSIRFIKLHPKTSIVSLLLLLLYYFCLPKVLFNDPISTVVTASNNELLGAVIASDGQWRFPEIDSVPNKFKQSVLYFEDEHFYHHPGFNPISITKALLENIKEKRIVRGGSTITQQVIRLSRKQKKRSYIEKLIEFIWATRLELRYSKNKILTLYASHAPFGGNVVGLEMAAWRYYGLQPHQLSWAESATLAVLPNAPSLIYPGKNQKKLMNKRNRLLKKLYDNLVIDSTTYVLALEENLPKKPYDLPNTSQHLVQEVAKDYNEQRIQTSIDLYKQQQINQLVKQHYNLQKQNEVFNIAVLVVDVATRKIISYVGNSPTDNLHQKDVNNIISGRSTGSTLKPILYAHALQSGDLLPNQLLPDIPTQIANYTPKNFDLSFDGAVPANEALTRSLNIPAVRLLRTYGLEKFRDDLKDYRVRHITQSADYYGLSLILGGSEASLWDLCKIYSGYAGIINHYEALKHNYYEREFIEPSYIKNRIIDFGAVKQYPQIIDASSVYLTFDALTEVNRPATEQSWKYFDSSQKIAWKTGTSFGNKDAWAIGVTPKYVVGVWIGNSDGEGRPNLTGVSSAGPLLFNVFDVLPKSNWFLEPYEDMIDAKICTKSGYLALPICPSVTKRIQKSGENTPSCPYHIEVQLNHNKQFRVNANCESTNAIINTTWFALPPLQEYFYKQKNINYKKLPKFRSDCTILEQDNMAFVYPIKYNSKISLSKDFNGELNPIIIKLTHKNTKAKVHWYLDNNFIMTTENYHELPISPKKGLHVITAIDNNGNEKKRVLNIY